MKHHLVIRGALGKNTRKQQDAHAWEMFACLVPVRWAACLQGWFMAPGLEPRAVPTVSCQISEQNIGGWCCVRKVCGSSALWVCTVFLDDSTSCHFGKHCTEWREDEYNKQRGAMQIFQGMLWVQFTSGMEINAWKQGACRFGKGVAMIAYYLVVLCCPSNSC